MTSWLTRCNRRRPQQPDSSPSPLVYMLYVCIHHTKKVMPNWF